MNTINANAESYTIRNKGYSSRNYLLTQFHIVQRSEYKKTKSDGILNMHSMDCE
jgi:hypothetical protein